MSQSLQIRAFFFNAKTDYLPYYKNFTISVAKDATAKAILEAIQTQNENFAYPELNLVFKINDLVVEEDTPIATIVAKLGTSLTIDPVNSYRSNNGLIINNHDFMKSFDLLAPYATESDKKYYKTLYALHYASETEKFERDYIGDAILILAHKMISDGNEHKTEILNAISSVHSGLLDCEYENNLFHAKEYEADISALKDMVKNDDNSEYPSLLDMIKNRLGIKNPQKAEISDTRTAKTIDNLSQMKLAYNAGTSSNRTFLEVLKTLDIELVNTKRTHKLSGLSLIADNKTLALTKAGATILDAFDAGAEVLIVEDTATYEMMEANFSAIENTIGRKIIGFELICADDFMTQLNSITA